MIEVLSTPVDLPCGARIANRIAKAAMSEGIADGNGRAGPRMAALYRAWGQSGAGLLFSGNFQVDRWHLERPGNVVIDGAENIEGLARVAEAGRAGGAHFWAQLGHTGRQVSDKMNSAPLAPSAVDIEVPPMLGRTFATPRAMTEAEILNVVDQFTRAARVVQAAGFSGVHIHGAHGYLVSQFLNPLSNRRSDQWGGTLANRARFLLVLIAALRAAVGPEFPIGLKLNASDFMKGGFTNAECLELVGWLNETGLDLLELSGGSLEQPKLAGITFRDEGEDGRPASTIKREAFFVEFAAAVRKVARMPVMVTGGFRTAAAMAEAIDGGELDLVGLGRPFTVDPAIAHKLLSGELDRAPSPEDSLAPFHVLSWSSVQVERLGDGVGPDLDLTGEAAAETFKTLEGAHLADLLAAREPVGLATA
jgi:2,4-dienoyl-CoA reductase-like NADH-dependent reductase (Old Yellow Enzyme family)